MSEAYKHRSGKLCLKGEERKKSKKSKKEKKEKKAKKRKHEDNSEKADEEDHGGWYQYKSVEEMKPGLTSIEFGDRAYVFSLDTGLFTLGVPRKGEGENGSPQPEEQYFLSKLSDTKIALKSGYGKYLAVAKSGEIMGRSDAITPLEQFEPVWQETEGKTKCAILAANGCFIEFNDEGDLIAENRTASENNFVCIRTNIPKPELNPIPLDERGTEEEVELAVAKKYQHWQDMRMKTSKEDIANVKKARKQGTLHTELLNRRTLMKSDKYCK